MMVNLAGTWNNLGVGVGGESWGPISIPERDSLAEVRKGSGWKRSMMETNPLRGWKDRSSNRDEITAAGKRLNTASMQSAPGKPCNGHPGRR